MVRLATRSGKEFSMHSQSGHLLIALSAIDGRVDAISATAIRPPLIGLDSTKFTTICLGNSRPANTENVEDVCDASTCAKHLRAALACQTAKRAFSIPVRCEEARDR
jgi:hypothetical protein